MVDRPSPCVSARILRIPRLNRAFGVYSVLLTYRFFSVLLQGASTPLLSCNLRKGSVSRECDLAVLFELLRYGKRHRDVILILLRLKLGQLFLRASLDIARS